MCVGLVRTDLLMRARAEGVGNSILLVGADTGRDGIHGASFASLELDENSSERRPAVQVGNPFLEKCLLEACMDLSHTDAVVAIQDLGAAGLTSAVGECAGRVEGAGARIDVGRVPRRERGMTPYDVMLSESQERMLVFVQRGREREVESIFHAWDLTSAAIGEVTDDGHLTVFDSRDQVAHLPVRLLTEGAPMRRLVGVAPEPPLDLVIDALPPLADAGATLLRLLASPNLSSRRGVFRRYDHMVGDATVVPPGGDAAMLRVKGTRLGAGFRADGDFVLLIGSSQNDLGGSEYLKVEHGYVAGRPPALDLTREQAVNRVVLAAAQSGYLHSAHDCADGGMLVALAECSLLGGTGVRCPAIRPEPPLRLDAAFFGESPSRYIVSVPSRAMPEMQSLARRHHVELSLLGLTGGDTLEFEGQLKLSLAELRQAWEVMLA